MEKPTGLAKAREICANREQYARRMKDTGKKIIGYVCDFSPPEIIYAAGMHPYRLMGKLGAQIEKSNAFIEPYGCPLIRNCFEQGLQGKLDFLDGLVFAHSCDMVQRVYGIWTYYQNFKYKRMINVPHQLSDWSQDFYYRELGQFKESLEEYAGEKIAPGDLASSIRLYDHNRALVKDLYELQRQNPAKFKGSELLQVLIAGQLIDPREFTVLLEQVLIEAGIRKNRSGQGPRLLMWGSVQDNIALLDLIEESGGNVVIDDYCIGTRGYWKRKCGDGDPLRELVCSYFVDFRCPRTDRGPGTERFDYLLKLAQGFHADGMIGYVLSFCDPHKLDYPDLRDFLKANGLPVLLLDDDYTLSNRESLKNRIEAFLEILVSKKIS